MTDQTIAGLRAARALIERGWTQGEMARDKYGRTVNANARTARSWCADGACESAADRAGTDAYALIRALREQLLRDGSQPLIFEYNDAPDRTQADVLALFDRALARLEAEKQP